ncbi:carboxylesterase 5A-like isoform X1 [Lingula anatina]|uniref:Carboxylic ester hydrolase n=1 Tax=Lingula anatina TaxID=7574 RepID=A0A1S3HGV2_LINAN|nr:carboxylesterase 5A-like isoform X1 [Lingula anatina]XP_013385278.1 carboxylesterase 5A-like isoform X1 [Lingula anatina]XP_023932849.1 carboxylesterase 5A-like isoform X1 [Lingula anatina]|eukprot:XP_013385277.1 carboxylesterase 5A-like isoform X1 [Lingula anatina]
MTPASPYRSRSNISGRMVFLSYLHVFLMPLLLSVTCAISHSTINTVEVVINTKLGQLRGQTVTTNDGSDVTQFLGVPFANPPLETLRFEPPQKVDCWAGVLDATEFGPMCVQDLSPMFDVVYTKEYIKQRFPHNRTSEDCLSLNIFIPGHVTEITQSLPVMVYVHGGAYEWGTGMNFDGSMLASHGNVIVVTLNYRLGLFGFFTTGVAESPGNMALLDQVAALEWVRENIETFGGDPSSVTLFGNSAGGASISLLALSSLSRGLFNRAILQSGLYQLDLNAAPNLPLSSDSVVHHSIEIARMLCADSKRRLLECMKRKSVAELQRAYHEYKEQHFGPIVTPRVDGYFLKKEDFNPEHLSGLPIMLGIVKDESTLFLGLIGQLNRMVDLPTIEEYVKTQFPVNVNHIHEVILFEYLGGLQHTSANLRRAYIDILNDYFSLSSHSNYTDVASGVTNTYFYYFNHRPSFSHWPIFSGATHMDELYFVFGDVMDTALFGDIKPSEAEKTLSKQIMDAWTTFAREGTPTKTGMWPPYSVKDRSYLEWETNGNKVEKDLRCRQRQFWLGLVFKTLINSDKK